MTGEFQKWKEIEQPPSPFFSAGPAMLRYQRETRISVDAVCRIASSAARRAPNSLKMLSKISSLRIKPPEMIERRTN
jgi:hypothetical protein